MQCLRRHLIRFLAATAVLASVSALGQSEEVPFITSPDSVTLEMLRIANVGPGDHVVDLGSGDGRIVILAAKRFGATGLGVEIVPELVGQSIRSAREAGVAERVTFRQQDLFQTDFSAASVITMYLLPQVNLQLRPALLALKPGTRVVSHDWDMGDWQPDRTTVVPVPDKQVGVEKSSKVHLWVVPARMDGLWCGTAALREFRLRLSQRYQEVQGSLARRDRVRVIEGRIDGSMLRTQATRVGSLVLTMAGDELAVTSGEGALALARGATFRRAAGATCDG
ncbi:MAG TPA: methyltransferase domain-containing protein [Ramlibacter sp.]|nr:methyltransferase domain-containing protein [Ramlibacter sp.]